MGTRSAEKTVDIDHANEIASWKTRLTEFFESGGRTEGGTVLPNSPDRDSTRECAEHLVTLIVHQDNLTGQWLRFLITIETGLAVGLGILLSPTTDRDSVIEASPLVVNLAPGLGIAIGLVIVFVAVHERRWSGWYIKRFNALDGFQERVFPAEGTVLPGRFSSTVSKAILAFGAIIIVGWAAVWYLLPS